MLNPKSNRRAWWPCCDSKDDVVVNCDSKDDVVVNDVPVETAVHLVSKSSPRKVTKALIELKSNKNVQFLKVSGPFVAQLSKVQRSNLFGEILGGLPRLTKLSLSHFVDWPLTVHDLFMSLLPNTLRLEELELFHVVLDLEEEDVTDADLDPSLKQSIQNQLSHLRDIRMLDFTISGRLDNDSLIHTILSTWTSDSSPNLHTLYLRPMTQQQRENNPFHDVAGFVKVFINLPTLQTLRVQNVQVNNDQMAEIMLLLQSNSTLNTLMLECPEMDFECCSLVALMLQQNTCLEKLFFNSFSINNTFDRNGLLAIIQALRTQTSRLRVLHVDYDVKNDAQVLDSLIETLAENRILRDIRRTTTSYQPVDDSELIVEKRARVKHYFNLNSTGLRNLTFDGKTTTHFLSILASQTCDLSCIFYVLRHNPSFFHQVLQRT